MPIDRLIAPDASLQSSPRGRLGGVRFGLRPGPATVSTLPFRGIPPPVSHNAAGGEGAWTVIRVLGERAGLVGADDVGGCPGFPRRVAYDDGVAAAMRPTPKAREMVRAAGMPSGMAPTATQTAAMNKSSHEHASREADGEGDGGQGGITQSRLGNWVILRVTGAKLSVVRATEIRRFRVASPWR